MNKAINHCWYCIFPKADMSDKYIYDYEAFDYSDMLKQLQNNTYFQLLAFQKGSFISLFYRKWNKTLNC